MLFSRFQALCTLHNSSRSFFFYVLRVQFWLSVCLEPQHTSSCVIAALVRAADLRPARPSLPVAVSLGLNAAHNAASRLICLSSRAEEVRLKNLGLNYAVTYCFNQPHRDRRGALKWLATISFSHNDFSVSFPFLEILRFELRGLIMTLKIIHIFWGGFFFYFLWHRTSKTICLFSTAKQEVCSLLRESGPWQGNRSFTRKKVFYCQNKLATFPHHHCIKWDRS